MHRCLAWLCALLLAPGWAADLTATEQRWLQGAWPVLLHARDAGIALDVVVQPQPAPDSPPIGMAFIGGRCKLVFSMRGNPEVPATEARLPPALFGAAVELMAAHELGHCRRLLDGTWRGLPAGFVDSTPDRLAGDDETASAEMQTVRREEAYADLVGLAWVRQRHPSLYPQLHAWLLAERSHERVAGDHHDTLAWVRLAQDGSQLAGATMFDAAAALWLAGLARVTAER